MDDLERVVAAYKAMDQRCKEETLRHMERMAKTHPLRLFRVVAGGGRVEDEVEITSK